MLRSVGATSRTLVIFAFLLIMPLLAIPPVAEWVETRAAAFWPTATRLVLGGDAPAAAPAALSPANSDPLQDPVARSEKPAVEDAPETTASFDRRPQQPLNCEPDQDVRLAGELHHLRRLGAREMHWETDDDGTQRFVCHVPLDAGGIYARPFVASATDRLTSIQHVRHEIESWRQALRARQGSLDIEVGLHVPTGRTRAADATRRPMPLTPSGTHVEPPLGLP